MSNTQSHNKFIKSFHKFTEDYNKEILEKINGLTPTFPALDDELKKQIEDILSSMSYKPDTNTKNVVKKKREPTAYNLFMKDMIKELREKHPEIDKTDLMKRGAEEWQKKKAKLAEDAVAVGAGAGSGVGDVSPPPPTQTKPPTGDKTKSKK
jgi:hypothetical protein